MFGLSSGRDKPGQQVSWKADLTMCWGDRQQVQELRHEVNRLRAIFHGIIEYCDDDTRMGNFVEKIRFEARKGLDRTPPGVA